MAAELALAVRPRYHVAGGKQVFYARSPYLNSDLGAGSHVTRFISLAEVRLARRRLRGRTNFSFHIPWLCYALWLGAGDAWA